MSLPPEFAHTYPLQESFTGRVHERQTLTKWFTQGNQPVLALIALGGMGKSSLAWFWMQHDLLYLPRIDQYQDTLEVTDCRVPIPFRPEGVFWWSFYENEAHFIAFLDAALAYIDNREAKSAILSSSTYAKVRILLKLLQQRRILLILDGFERELHAYNYLSAVYNGDTPGGGFQENFRSCINPYVADFLRGLTSLNFKSRILITSRLLPQELDGLVGCQQIELNPLDPDDAIGFFYAQGVKGSRADIQKLCTLYGYHPLTLRLLVGLIRSDPASPGDLEVITHYDPIPELLQRKHHILEIAYNALNPSTRELLSRIAAFRSRVDFNIVKVISTFGTDKELKDALKNLIERGFLLFDRQQRSYDLHPVVRHYAYDRLLNKELLHTHLLNYFASIPQEMQIQSLEDLTPTIELYHHAILAQKHDIAWNIYNERLRTPLYYHLCEYELDLQLLDAIPRTTDGSPRLSSSLAQIWTILYTSMCYERTGQAKQGVKIIENAIRIARKVKDETNLACALIPYAMSLCNLGRLKQANDAAFEATTIFDRVGDLNWRGISHRSYGRVLMYCGNIPKAAEEFNTAKDIYELGSKFEHGNSILLIYLSQLALLQSKPTKALQLVQQAKELSQVGAFKREQVLAMWLKGVILITLALESVDIHDANLKEAQTVLNKALTQCKSLQLLEAEPDILLAFTSWYSEKGESHEAWKYASQALTLANKIEDRLKQAEIYNMMAQMALDSLDYNAANQYAQQAYNYAICDGPPYSYQSALERASQILNRVQKH